MTSPTEQLARFSGKKERHLIGLMSGMSMDGINLAHVKISGNFPDLKIDLVGSECFPYEESIREHLKSARHGSVEDVATLDFEVGQTFAAAVQNYLSANKLNSKSIDAIGSHGQSLFGKMLPNGKTRTIQVGSGSVIAERTNILTVFNFRIRDIAVGGNAAPLVPLLDYVLFREQGKTVALNNLGSISNTTVVTENIKDVIATDLGPANMPIDFFAEKMPITNGIDRDGAFSAKGHVNQEMLSEMMAIDFLKAPIPKAAAFDEFGPIFLKQIANKFSNEKPENLLRTAVEFSAQSTATAYRKFIFPRFPELKLIKFSGGGVYNKTLMRRIEDLLPECKIENMATMNKAFADAKEAMAFALLAHETLCGRPGNVPGATRAEKATLLGEVAFQYS